MSEISRNVLNGCQSVGVTGVLCVEQKDGKIVRAWIVTGQNSAEERVDILDLMADVQASNFSRVTLSIARADW